VLTQLLSAPSRTQACGEQVPGGPAGGSTQPTTPVTGARKQTAVAIPKLRQLR